MGDVGMDQVLEAVADAVAQLVLFSVEAEENNSMLPNIVPGAEGVQRAVDVLVDIASELAAKYGSEKAIQDKMFESAKQIKKATQQIVDDAKALHADQFNQAAKKSLLRSAKEVLQGTVKELHLADKYDVIKIVKAANLCKENVDKGNEVTTTEQVMDIARSLSSAVVALVKLVNARVLLLVDPILKRRLETANTTLKNGTQGLVKAMGEALKQPSNTALRAEQRRVARELQDALDEIILVAQLSCKTMFDSLDLDFGIDAPKRPSIQELRECHERICREVDNLEAASSRNAADGAANALFMINGAIMQEVKIATAISEDCNDTQKADILEACDDVEKMPSLLTPGTKAALTRNAPPQAKDSLRKLEQETKDASAAVLAAALRSLSAGDSLASVSASLDQHLGELVDGVDRGDRAGAARSVKAVADDTAQAVAIARAIADVTQDPVVANLIMQASSNLADLQPQLVASTKAGLTGDPAAIKRLHDDADAMKEANARLRDAATLSPAELLRKRAQELQDELRRLEEAVKNADLQAAARHLKQARDLIAEQLALAQSLAENCDDPVRKKMLEDAIARLRELDQQLVPLAKAALSGDKAAQAKLAQLLAEVMRVADELARAGQPTPEEQLRANMAAVEAALEKLSTGLETGDTRSARGGAREAGTGIEKEGGLLGKLHDTELDPLRKHRFAEAMHALERLRPELSHASDYAIANPNDLAARDEVERIAQQIRDAHKELNKCFPSRAERMGELARVVGDNLDKLSHAASVGDRPGATSAVKAAVAAVQQQLDLSVPIAASMNDEAQRQRVINEAAQLKALAPTLVQATKAALDSPNDKHKQAQLDDAIADVTVSSDALARASALSPADNLADGAASINARFNDLVRHAARPDPAAVDLTNRKLAKAVPKQVELARDFAVRDGDPVYQRQVETNAQELNRLLPLIRDASAKAAANPRDKKLQKDLGDLVDLAKVASSALIPTTSSPEDQIQASTAAVAEELARLGKAVDSGDKHGAREALSALRGAGAQQVDLARLIAGRQEDPQLRADLLKAAKELEELLKQIEPLTESALANPSSAPALHKALDDAQGVNARIGQLATKPTALQIIANAPHVHHALDQLEAGLGSKEQALPALAKAQAALRKQAQLVKVQASKETDPSRKAALKQALQELDEVLAQLPDAVRASVEGSRDPRKAKALIRQGHEATDKSVAAVTPSARDQLLSAYGKLAAGVDQMPPAVAHQSPKERDAALSQVDRAVAELNRLAPVVAKENPAAARAITQASSKLPPAQRHFADSTDNAYKAPRDAKKQSDLVHAGEELVAAGGQLAAAGNEKSLKDEILDTSVLADAALDRLTAAVRKGNLQDAADALHDAKEALQRQAALARALAAITNDPAQRKELENAAREVEKALQKLEPATHEALAHPNSREAQRAFGEAVQEAKMANAGVVAAAHPGGDADLMLGAKEINDLLRKVAEAIKAGDRKGALAALDELEKKMRRQGALCKALALRTTDPNKRRWLLEAAAALQNGLRTLLGPLRDSIERGDPDALDILAKLQAEAARAEKALNAAMAPEEPEDEIMQAARHVEQVVAAKLDIDESTPEGRIYAIARRIAQEMALMSEAAARGANSEVIVISRRIHTLVQALQKDAQDVAAMCKDPILREQVQSVALTISNISVQLKIITAVKAAGGDSDPTVKAQLVKCAKGLASNVVNLCNATEIASIRMI